MIIHEIIYEIVIKIGENREVKNALLFTVLFILLNPEHNFDEIK